MSKEKENGVLKSEIDSMLNYLIDEYKNDSLAFQYGAMYRLFNAVANNQTNLLENEKEIELFDEIKNAYKDIKTHFKSKESDKGIKTHFKPKESDENIELNIKEFFLNISIEMKNEENIINELCQLNVAMRDKKVKSLIEKKFAKEENRLKSTAGDRFESKKKLPKAIEIEKDSERQKIDAECEEFNKNNSDEEKRNHFYNKKIKEFNDKYSALKVLSPRDLEEKEQFFSSLKENFFIEEKQKFTLAIDLNLNSPEAKNNLEAYKNKGKIEQKELIEKLAAEQGQIRGGKSKENVEDYKLVKDRIISKEEAREFGYAELNTYASFNTEEYSNNVKTLFKISREYYENEPTKGIKELAEIRSDKASDLLQEPTLKALKSKIISFKQFATFNKEALKAFKNYSPFLRDIKREEALSFIQSLELNDLQNASKYINILLLVKREIISKEEAKEFSDDKLNAYASIDNPEDIEKVKRLFKISREYYKNEPIKGIKELAEIKSDQASDLLQNSILEPLESKIVTFKQVATFNKEALKVFKNYSSFLKDIKKEETLGFIQALELNDVQKAKNIMGDSLLKLSVVKRSNALEQAARNSDIQVFAKLLEKRVVSLSILTSLYSIIDNEDERSLKLLLNSKAYKNATFFNNSFDKFEYALNKGKFNMAKILIESEYKKQVIDEHKIDSLFNPNVREDLELSRAILKSISKKNDGNYKFDLIKIAIEDNNEEFLELILNSDHENNISTEIKEALIKNSIVGGKFEIAKIILDSDKYGKISTESRKKIASIAKENGALELAKNINLGIKLKACLEKPEEKIFDVGLLKTFGKTPAFVKAIYYNEKSNAGNISKENILNLVRNTIMSSIESDLETYKKITDLENRDKGFIEKIIERAKLTPIGNVKECSINDITNLIAVNLKDYVESYKENLFRPVLSSKNGNASIENSKKSNQQVAPEELFLSKSNSMRDNFEKDSSAQKYASMNYASIRNPQILER